MNDLIRQKNDPLLRQKAAAVTAVLPDPKINELLETMNRALAARPDGVALAAPQIGSPYRLFIVSAKALGKDGPSLVFINPQIIKKSKKQVDMIEGCLSVRRIYGRTRRYEKVTVTARDENGRIFTRHTSGLMSQIVQHEIDHLEGILFTDRAKDLIAYEPDD